MPALSEADRQAALGAPGGARRRLYLLTNGHAGRLVEHPDWDGDWHARYFPGSDPRNVAAYRLDGVTPHGIPWNEELAGASGMSFALFRVPGKTTQDVAAARRWLRGRRDAVHFQLHTIAEWR